MKIIILGAGQVGGTLAEHLANEKNDITVVDHDEEKLRLLRDRLDIRTVAGHASHPDTIFQAGAEDADMLIAVTSSDEINMMACQVAYSLFSTHSKIARVRSPSYLSRPELFTLSQPEEELWTSKHVPINVLISPEQLVTDCIHELIAHPGALQVLNFAGGRAQLVAVRAYYDGPIVGQELRQIRKHMPDVDTRIAAIFRRGQPIIPEATTIVEAEDEVFFISAQRDTRAVMAELRKLDQPYRRIMIAGGGNVGSRLAADIEEHYQVKVIEHSKNRCRELSERLKRAIVLHGSASDKDLLSSENIDKTDVFCALTNNDEANIMVAMLAKRMGAHKVISVIGNQAYADVLQGDQIDITLSPQQITIGSLLAHVRRGDVSNVHSLRRGAAEAIEVTAHGEPDVSQVVGRRLDELALPGGVTIGAVVRGDEVLIAHRHIVVAEGDHLILFLVDKTSVDAVERLFEADFSHF